MRAKSATQTPHTNLKIRTPAEEPARRIPQGLTAIPPTVSGRGRRFCAASIAVLLAAFSAAESRAATYYWDADAAGSAATGGTGNWDIASAIWRIANPTGTLTAWPSSGGDNDANLGGTAGTLTLATGIFVNDITVNPSPSGTYTVTGAQTLTLNGTAQSVLDVASGSTLTITSGLAGLNGFTKSSAGTLILDSAAGTATLFGDIAVNGGTLQAGTATNNGASQVLRSNAVNLAGGTSLTTGGSSGNRDLRVGALSGSGSVTPASGGAINELALMDASFSGTITTSGGMNLRGTNVQTFSSTVSGLTGTIGISGAGLGSGSTSAGLTLSGTAALTGASTDFALRGGTLTLDNTGGNTGAGAATDRMLNGGAITANGGTLSLLGNATNGSTETAGAFTLNAGAATISVTHNGGSGGTVLTLASLARTSGIGGTINFIGTGGTLGAANGNPRIIFTAAPNTSSSALVTTSAPKVGFATVNGTDFAGYDATNGVTALVATTVSGALTTAATQNSVLNASGTIAGSTVTYNTLKILAGASATLDLTGSGNLATTGILLAGSDDFTIRNTGSGTGGISGGDDRFVYVANATTTLNVATSLAASQQKLTKSGDGFLALTGTSNQLGFTTNNRNVVVAAGVLRGTTTNLGGGTSSGGALTTIQMRGGTLEISGGGTFVRAIDQTGTASGGGITFDEGSTERGNGGFSAINGDAIITLVTTVGGATAASLVWDDGKFLANGYALIMGSTKADSRVDLTNNIGLDDGTAGNSYFAREIRVTDNVSSGADWARMTGVISGSANADLLKTGSGMLELTGSNTYSGNTLIRGGTLAAGGGLAIPNSSAVVLSNAAGATFQLNNSETIGTLSGGGATGGNVNIQGNTLTVGDQRDSTFAGVISGSGGAVVKQGSGIITLTGANTFTGGTTLSEGTTVAGNNSAFGSTGAQTLIFNGGRLASDNDARSLPNNLTVNNVAGNQVTGTNSVTLTGTASGPGTLEVALTNAAKSVTVTPASANSFAPDMLRLTSGTLLLGGANKIGDSTAVNFNGGTLNTGGFSDTVGALTLTANSVLDFGTTNNVHLQFSSAAWTAGALTVNNWTGTDFATGNPDQFLVASAGPLDSSFVAQISFTGHGAGAVAYSVGGGLYEIVPVPEPTTVLGALGLLAFLAYRERRRVSRLWSLHVAPPLILLGFLLVSFVTKDTD